jgi:hypothetical protein
MIVFEHHTKAPIGQDFVDLAVERENVFLRHASARLHASGNGGKMVTIADA